MTRLTTFLTLLFAVVACFSSTEQKALSQSPFPTPKVPRSIKAEHAAVTSAHPLASQVGIDILQKGGNAVDAAIAMQFALAVVYPGAGNLGGGGFMVLKRHDGTSTCIDYREKAPALATRNMYLNEKGEVIDKLSTHGHWAVGVPGTVAGLFKSHQHATLPMCELIQPAIKLAKQGFLITEKEAKQLNAHLAEFKAYNTTLPAFYKATPWKAGDVLIQPELAQTLKRICKSGQDGFYKGKTAKLIVAEMERHKGLIQHTDLQAYQAVERTPLQFKYKDFEFTAMPPPSSGGIVLALMLEMLEPYNIGKLGFHSTESIHLMTEAERRAYADRAQHLGDPDFWDVPQWLSDSLYADSRMLDFNPIQASSSKSIKAGQWQESSETTHLCVVDAQGNAVAVTTTLNDTYGSKVVVEGAGFFLNNEMDDFSAKPGVPNIYGLVGAEANAIVPHKRMLSSMTPTIIHRNGQLYMVLGTPGGSTIITTVFQIFLNVAEFGLDLEQAIDVKRFHHQWLPDKIQIEANAFPADIVAKLEKMGHIVAVREPIGRANAIHRLPNGQLHAVGDLRGDDTGMGY